jgi:acyl carrier protein
MKLEKNYTANLKINKNMTNLEKYNAIFTEVFGATTEQLGDNYSKETVSEWDSVHQLNIISLLEETFDLMLDPEDIMACTSYNAGKEILAKNDILL